MNFIKSLFCQDQDLREKLDQTVRDAREIQKRYNGLVEDYNSQEKTVKELKQQVGDLKAKNKSLSKTLRDTEDVLVNVRERLAQRRTQTQDQSEVLKFIDERFEETKRKAYEDKRYYDDQEVTIYLDELIAPESYLVSELFKTDRRIKDIKEFCKSVQETCHHNLTWTSDKTIHESGDRYLHPRETITRGKGDCEDITYVAVSANPQKLVAAWGYIANSGHCFPITVLDGELFVVDCSDQTPAFTPLRNSEYEAHWIITQGYTYRARDNPTRFGDIAREIHSTGGNNRGS